LPNVEAALRRAAEIAVEEAEKVEKLKSGRSGKVTS
jgi:hypothetical protein